MAVEGFEVDVRGAEVTALELDSETAVVTIVVPIGNVGLTFKPTRLVRHE